MIKRLGPKKASELGGGNHDRWRSVSKGAVRVSTEEIDVLVKVYPHYALWLVCGQIAPEIGQTSPAYDDTHPDLSPSSAD
ncbi:DNA-binding protein [Metapseudomonas otitidis]|uniref:DNA-binding protein n=1 Tax=Metapseudomonas otitidis TaxID=319939 RepID=UPI001F115241|nr:DNA-binding protein [Pseudomonas otitidis]